MIGYHRGRSVSAHPQLNTADTRQERPPGPPRLPSTKAPYIPAAGAIPDDPERMPDVLRYDAGKRRLVVGSGHVENVDPNVWSYEVSGKQVLTQWFSYRKAHRERPIIGERRTPSPLGALQPDHWLPQYTTELINVLNVLGLLVELEPVQANLLDKVCSGPLISAEDLRVGGALELPTKSRRSKRESPQPKLFVTTQKPTKPTIS